MNASITRCISIVTFKYDRTFNTTIKTTPKNEMVVLHSDLSNAFLFYQTFNCDFIEIVVDELI